MMVSGRFTKEQLEAMETEALQNLADLAKGAAVSPAPAVPGVVNYAGAAPAPTVQSAGKVEEPLSVPKIEDFAPPKK